MTIMNNSLNTYLKYFTLVNNIFFHYKPFFGWGNHQTTRFGRSGRAKTHPCSFIWLCHGHMYLFCTTVGPGRFNVNLTIVNLNLQIINVTKFQFLGVSVASPLRRIGLFLSSEHSLIKKKTFDNIITFGIL